MSNCLSLNLDIYPGHVQNVVWDFIFRRPVATARSCLSKCCFGCSSGQGR